MASDLGDNSPWQAEHHQHGVVVTMCLCLCCVVLCGVNHDVKSEPILSVFNVFRNVGRFVLPVKVCVSLTPLTAPLDCRYPPLSSISRCLASDHCRADTETDISSLVSVFLIM